jgi:amino acid transporter
MSDKQAGSGASCNTKWCGGIFWWTMLVVAVLAIPSIAIVFTAFFPAGDFGTAITFMAACWASTWIGMWLMKKSKEQQGSKPGSTPPNE